MKKPSGEMSALRLTFPLPVMLSFIPSARLSYSYRLKTLLPFHGLTLAYAEHTISLFFQIASALLISDTHLGLLGVGDGLLTL